MPRNKQIKNNQSPRKMKTPDEILAELIRVAEENGVDLGLPRKPEKMNRIKFTPQPSEMPGSDGEWLNRIALCATSCAKTMETRKLRANEIPVVLGTLIVALADHSGMSVETVNGMVTAASVQLRDSNPSPAAA